MITYDVDAGGLGDYSEIQAAIAVIPASLADNYTLALRSSDDSAFTTLVSIPAKTLNGFSILIQPIAGERAVKSGWDNTKVRLVASATSAQFAVLYNQCDGVVIDGLQISNTVDASGYCVRIDNADGTVIKNNRHTLPGGADDAVLVSGTATNTKIENSIAECTGVQGSGSEGYYCFGNTVISNCIVRNFNDGIEQDAGITKAVNCAVFDNVTDFDAVTTISYCMSDDGSGTNPQSPSLSDWDNEFVDYANGDYTALETGNLSNGIGPASDSDVPTEDIDGDARTGTTTYIGVDEPASTPSAAVPNDLTLSAIILDQTSAGLPVNTFSYNDMLGGFSGFFDLLTDANERRFNVNSLWSGTIKGTEAKLKTNATATPYVVFVDGVDSNPTVSAGEITLFTGLSDTVHDVSIFPRLAYSGSGNGLNINETEILTVTGSSSAIVNLPSKYVTDPTFQGQSTDSTVATLGGNYTPTWEQVSTYNRERGQVIFNAQIDELYLFTDDTGVWLSIDNGTPVNITFTETNTFATIAQRRLAKVSDSLDNTQVHQYTIWYESRVDYGVQGIVLKNNGAAGSFSSYSTKKAISQYGDSITYGSEGATVGEADTYLHGIANNYAVHKAGENGETSAGLALEIPSIVSASFVPDWAILAIGRNDYANVAGFQSDYTACIDALLTAGITKIICRGITPNDSSDARIITMNSQISDIVDTYADPNIVYVDTDAWIPITTTDGTHPTAAGYVQLAAFEDSVFDAIINVGASPNDLTLSSIVLDQASASRTVKPNDLTLSAIELDQATIIVPAKPNDLNLSAIILGVPTDSSSPIISVSISGSITTKTTIKGAL